MLDADPGRNRVAKPHGFLRRHERRPRATPTSIALRKRSRILYVFAIGSAGMGGAMLAGISACGSAASSNVLGPSSAYDAGAAADGALGSVDSSLPTVASDGGGFGGDSGGTLVPPSPTTILAVHASANLYDFRLCFGLDDGGIVPVPAYPDDPAHPMPETNYPGVPVGGAALLPPILFGGESVTAYVVPAYYLQSQGYVAGANEPTCDVLIPKYLKPQNVEYFALPPVPLPSSGGTIVLAVEGCGAGAALTAGSVAQCGASFVAGTANLTALAGALAAEDAGAWTVQLADLSPSLDPGDGGPALSYVDPTIDASIPLAAPPSSLTAAPMTVPLSEAGVTAAYFVIGPSSSSPLTQSLAEIQYFQAPASDPFTYFSAPTTYFVAVVGDATDAAAPVSLPDGAANPAFDGHGLHVIAYPETGN
jgi:hypothetical protein